MFVRVKEKPNGKKSIQIVESFRRGDKVSQKIVRHVGQAVTDREVEELKRLARSIIAETKNDRQPVLPLFSPEEFFDKRKKPQQTEDKVEVKNLREEQRIIDGITDIFGKLYEDLSLNNIISGTKKDGQWNSILKSCVLARIANPVSKRRTASILEEDFAIKIDLEKIYRMMDHVNEHETEIKKQISQSTLSLFDNKVDILFFDVTTLYFESQKQDELRDFGYSKDGKYNETQITLALVSTTEGIPITYEVFPGNMYEGHTLIKMIKNLKQEHVVDNIVLVADRGMFNKENLELLEKENIQYIVGARLKTLPKAIKNEIIESDDYQASLVEQELHWVKEVNHNERRIIISYSSQRAKKDAGDRQRLIDRLLKKVNKGKIKIKDIIPNYGSKKYLQINNEDVHINEEKISEDAKWDGLHGVITNKTDASATEVLSRYRGLWQIEEAFRVNKHTLKMRPIYHWTEKRIKAHISICFLAYTLAKQAAHRIRIQQEPMSIEQIRNELLHVQSSLLTDITTKKRYIIPSHTTLNQKKIYQTFGLKRSEVPYAV